MLSHSKALGLALTLAVAMSAPAQASDELRAFRNAYQYTKRPAQRLEARAQTLGGLRGDSEDIAKVLLDATAAMEDEALLIERERRDYLSRGVADYELQPRAILGPLRELQGRIRDRLLALESPAAAALMARAALSNPKLPFTLRTELARFAVNIDNRAFARVAKALKSRHPDEVCVALLAVSARAATSGELVAPVLNLLAHRSPVVRELAAQALAALARPECVQPLVEQIGQEAGRTRQRFGRALEVLTRQPLPDHAGAWANWWNDHGQAVLSGQYELGGGTPRSSAGRQERDRERYHDIPIDGDSILYVLDRSRSMRKRLKGSLTLPDGRILDDRRILRAMVELVRSLHTLTASKQFNIVAFGAGSLAFADEMQRASEENIEAAERWVYALALEIGTSMYDGMDLAFALGGRPERDGFHEIAFDTMFVLTDGVPSISTAPGIPGVVLDSTDGILAAARRWNLLNRVVIHSIGLGDEFAGPFLGALAANNGGHFVEE